ncbi:MAG: family 16 glycoside hydrolase [Planctomycetota bacterium]
MKTRIFAALLIVLAVAINGLYAEHWHNFRGPGMRGNSDETGLAVTWSETENLKWKTALPGPGSSSPIVVGEKVFVTCYSGYGLDKEDPGNIYNLRRHLVCVDAGSGKILWDESIEAVQPELPFKGQLTQHGYAASTPASDGERVFAFGGKNGVFAFDLEGNLIWERSVGTGSDEKKWGSAGSVTLYKNLVIINAWDESKTLYAFDKRDGEVVWKRDLSEAGLTFTTPVLAEVGGRTELIMLLPTQVWGLNPDTGQTVWFVRTTMKDTTIGTPVVVGDVAYIHGGGVRSLSSMAVKLGGSGDVTDSHVLWSGKQATSVPSPVYFDGMLYWVDTGGKAGCQDTKTGELKYNEELPIANRFVVYASMVEAEGRLYAVSRKGGTYVLPAKPKFEVIATNKFASDDSDFNASPAIDKGRIFLRSNRYLYCIAKSAAAGRKSLFDGKTLSGWTILKCEAEVEDGKILIKEGNGLIQTDKKYGDFILEFEWKALRDNKWDSGVYFRYDTVPQGRPWPRRYQVNLRQSVEGNVSALPQARTTGLMKPGEWNKFKLTVKGTKASLEMNGKPAWKADGLEEPKTGYIALQAEVPGGGRHHFKNIYITELD